MTTHTDYLWFNTKAHQEFVRITDEVAAIVAKSGVTDGMVLVSAMHITSGVYVGHARRRAYPETGCRYSGARSRRQIVLLSAANAGFVG